MRSFNFGWRRQRDATVDDESRGVDSTPVNFACLILSVQALNLLLRLRPLRLSVFELPGKNR